MTAGRWVDFIRHNLWLRTSAGDARAMALVARTVADFYQEYMAILQAMQLEVRMLPRPVELVEAIPFAEDRKHAAYDAAWAHRFWQVLVQAAISARSSSWPEPPDGDSVPSLGCSGTTLILSTARSAGARSTTSCARRGSFRWHVRPLRS